MILLTIIILTYFYGVVCAKLLLEIYEALKGPVPNGNKLIWYSWYEALCLSDDLTK